METATILQEFEQRRGSQESPLAQNKAELRDAFAQAVGLAGVRLRLERGRQDARLNRVIIEFKFPGSFGGRADSRPFQEAFGQLQGYIARQSQDDGWDTAEYVGVAFDGFHLAYVFLENGIARHTPLVPLNTASGDLLFTYLAEDRRRAFTSENMLGDFGLGNLNTKRLLQGLWRQLAASLDDHEPRTQMLFAEWRRLFAQVADLTKAQQARLNNLGHSLGLGDITDFSRLLFVLHTYNAILLKLLAAELATSFRIVAGGSGGFCAYAATLPDQDLWQVLEEDIERSRLFQRVNIRNFIEGDFFTWYLEPRKATVLEGLRGLLQMLARYRLVGVTVERTRDLLKRLYEGLVWATMRKNLGEFYTPDWLAEFTLDRAGYVGEAVLDARLLDPTCGSGTFLILAIRRFLAAGRTEGLSDEELLSGVCSHIVGFDLNPLAVISARVNYLLAIAELLTTWTTVELPVYLADAIYAPTIRDTLSESPFDLIVGNPPWVRWSKLPDDYRSLVKPTCESYRIFSDTPYHGGNELDISGVILYTTMDKWLKEGGRLAFVITQSHFQAPSSQGVRRFHLGPTNVPLKVIGVDDFQAVNPFPKLANKPAVLVLEKGQETVYPVEYRAWQRRGTAAEVARLRAEESSWEQIEPLLESQPRVAMPVAPNGGRWSLLAPAEVPLLDRLKGGSPHLTGRKGVTTDLNGVYFIEVLGPGPAGQLRFKNTPESGDMPLGWPYEGNVESDLVFPMIKGAANIRAFQATLDHRCLILPNRGIHGLEPEAEFAARYRLAYEYFRRYQDLLVQRSTYRTRMLSHGAPFYAVYNVGPYTFQPWKVVWAEIAGSLQAAVIGQAPVPHTGQSKPVVPDHKVYFVAFDRAEEAHFVCALLNSAPVRTFADSFTVKTQVSNLFRVLRLPSYTAADPWHGRLAELSRQAHAGERWQAEIDTCALEVL